MTNFNHSAEQVFEQAVIHRIEFAGLRDQLIDQVLQRRRKVLTQVLVGVMRVLADHGIVPEIIAAVKWALPRLTDAGRLLEGGALALSAIERMRRSDSTSAARPSGDCKRRAWSRSSDAIVWSLLVT